MNSRINLFKILFKVPDQYIDVGRRQLFLNWLIHDFFLANKLPFSLHYTSKIQGVQNIIFKGNDKSSKVSFAVSGGCYFAIVDGTILEIGEGTLWAYNVCIQTANHGLVNRHEILKESIKIGKNCWLGNNVSVLSGVTLGDNVTVGANSVVTKSFPSNVVIAGCPAVIIKKI